jgi:hypothetical protein
MLPGEQGLPEEIFSHYGNIVNLVVQFVCKESDAYRTDRNFTYTTTTPIEREMRELNRRAEVGVRWSEMG